MSKKILIFSTAYFPLVGGAEVAVKEITDRLKGFQFDLVTAKIRPGLAKFEKRGNVNVYRVGFGKNLDKLLLPFLGLLKARQLERQNHYDSTWSIMASFGGFLGLFFKYLHPQKPWLLTLQEGDPPKEILKKVGFFKPLFKQIFRRADYIQAISSFLADWAKQMGAKCPIEVVPNGVDISHFRGKRLNSPFNLGIKPNEKIIITVSRLVKKNGVDDLIKAGQYLNFPFKILIVGSGPEESKLKKLVQDLNLQEKVIFLGHIPHENLPQYLSLADVFVRPSLSEGLGNVFLEAMAVGVPVIGTAVGGIPDFLKDKETGLFCQVNQPADIAKKIKMILEENTLREKIILQARKLVQEKYQWEFIAQKMENIFLNLID